MKLIKNVVLFLFMCCFITYFFLKPTEARLRFSRNSNIPFYGESNNNNNSISSNNNSISNSNNNNNNNNNNSNSNNNSSISSSSFDDIEEHADFEDLESENNENSEKFTSGVFGIRNGYASSMRNESQVGQGNFHDNNNSNNGNHFNVANIEKTTTAKDEVKHIHGENVFDERGIVIDSDEVEDETRGVEETRDDEERHHRYPNENSTGITAASSDEDTKEETDHQDTTREEDLKEVFGEDESDMENDEDKNEALYGEDSDTMDEEEEEEEEEEEDDDDEEEEETIDGVVQELREEEVSAIKENNSNENESSVANKNGINITKDDIVNNKNQGFGGFLIRTKQLWTHSNIYRIFEKPVSDSSSVNYFRNEMQNDFAFRNGLHFSCTSAYLYNKYVNSSKYAYIRLPESTMVILVTANKLFFQDLIYSSNKYLSIKNKFAYLMNSIVDTLKGKIFFKNYNYQYLFRNDPFAIDPTRKLLDFDLLGELTQTTQTIYVDLHGDKKVSMHKLYGGWFQFLGIMVVNGYYYNDTVKPPPIEVIPPEMIADFRDLIYQSHVDNYSYAYSLGLWRDFPNNKFTPWRYSLELLLWDSLNILPNQLPHPANFVLAYTNTLDKLVNEHIEVHDAVKTFLVKNVNHTKELLNWHILLKKFVREQTGLDVAIVKADDYYEQVGSSSARSHSKVMEESKNALGRSAYIVLLLLNSDFFNDKSLLVGNYKEAKHSSFFKKLVAIIDKIQQILEDIKHSLEPHIDPDVKAYNYLNSYEDNYKVFNPHILGSIAGITQHLKCENTKRYICKRDISIHYKYGGWFDFGAAILIKDIITVPLTYKKREIVKKEYENMILLQANSSYQDAGMWRDIPEKDTSPYRYSLQAFLLESPNLNIIDMQKAHPFVIIDLINKGLHAMNTSVINPSPKQNTEEDSKFGKKEKDEVDTIESAEEATILEHKIMEMKKKEPSLDEMKLNFGETIRSLDPFNKESEVFANDKKDEDLEKTYNNDFEEVEGKEEKVEGNENQEDEYDEQIVGNSDEEEHYRKIDAYPIYEETEETEETVTMDDDGDETEKAEEHIDISDEEGKIAESLKNVVDPSLLEKSNENDLQEIEHVYDKTSTEHDLNLQTVEDDESSTLQRNILLCTMILLLTIFITFSVYIGVKLYERFSKRRFRNKDDIVLGFKDNNVPVVHGVPAPWLKTELN